MRVAGCETQAQVRHGAPGISRYGNPGEKRKKGGVPGASMPLLKLENLDRTNVGKMFVTDKVLNSIRIIKTAHRPCPDRVRAEIYFRHDRKDL